MRKRLDPGLLVTLAIMMGAAPARADVRAGVSIDEGGLKGFYLAIGEHYGVTENEVVRVHERKVPDEDLPVIYFIARRADVSPEVVIKLRLGGKSWMEISGHFGISPDVYYVPVKGDPGPPYGKAYGHFKSGKSGKKKQVVLSDTDIVNLINLRFISEHYQCAPEDVIKLRSEGKSFVEINRNVKDARKQKTGKSTAAASTGGTTQDNAGKGKGKSEHKRK